MMSVMGRRGPKRKLRLLDSAPRERDADGLAAPEAVNSCPPALEVWRATIDRMKKLQTWSEADAPTVARYAVLSVLYSRYQAACLDGQDIMVVNKGGYACPTPQATQLLKIGAQLLQLEKALGLPAATRNEMPAPANAMDEVDELLRQYA
jgi:phage terminase small subunit